MFLRGSLARAIIVAAYATISFLILNDSKAASGDSEFLKLFKDGGEKMKRGEFSAAVIDFSKALELNTNCAECFSSRSWAKLRLRDSEGAEADATQSIRLDSKNVFAYTVRSLARSDKDDMAGALRDINQAIELKPQVIYLYELRGNIEE